MADFLAALREVAHISELTGLSIGALAGLAALVYFFPPARALAIQVAVVIVAAYFVGLYEYHLGTSDVRKQWDAANAAAERIAEAHDEAIGQSVKAEYMLQIGALQRQSNQYKQQVDQYEHAIIGDKNTAACQLGASALRLRQPKAR